MNIESTQETETEKSFPRSKRVFCGKTLVGWYFAIVYVHNKKNPNTKPTHLHFSFLGSGDCYLDEIAELVDQWTDYKKTCRYRYGPGNKNDPDDNGDHEYWRARKMAIQVVTTERERYLKKHGTAPDMFGQPHEPDSNLVKKKTEEINHKALERITGQSAFTFD